MTPDNAGQNVLADLDRLEEARKLRHVDGPSEFHTEMRRANLAIVTHNKLASDHLRPLLAALKRLRVEIESFNEHADACIFCGDASGEDHAEDCPIEEAEGALAALGRDIAKALKA